MSFIQSLKDKSNLIVGGGLIYIAIAEYSSEVPYPWEVPGAGVVITAGFAALVFGYLGAGKLDEFLPDEEGIFLIAFEASDDTGGAIWEITEDQFDAMEVHSGTLFEWPIAKRVYEVKEYRPEENVAVANWRESIAGSQLAGDCLVADAIDHIEEIRTELEPEAQKSRRLQRRIRSIIRKLDRRRMEDQQEILDPTTTPSFGKSGATVSEVVAEEVPEDLKPQSMKADSDPTNGHDENDTLGFDLLDDSEALQPDQ